MFRFFFLGFDMYTYELKLQENNIPAIMSLKYETRNGYVWICSAVIIRKSKYGYPDKEFDVSIAKYFILPNGLVNVVESISDTLILNDYDKEQLLREVREYLDESITSYKEV